MEKLCPEIVLEIFYRLPAESVVVCKFVCKSWYSLLPCGRGDDDDGNYFANMHLRRRRQHHQQQQHNLDYSTLNFISSYVTPLHEFRDDQKSVVNFYNTEYDEVEGLNCKVKSLVFSQNYISTRLVGSCNGLVCLTNTYERGTTNLKARICCICNPLLHEYITLPLSDLQFIMSYTKVSITGFGHNPITNEYKVVRVYYRRQDSRFGDVEVYTLGKTTDSSSNGGAAAGMWRRKGTIKYRLWNWASPSPYVLINGSIHWLANNGSEYYIVSFDLEDEEFGVIPLPSNVVVNMKSQLKELKGCLCLIVGDRINYMNLDIWVLKDYMNPKESWVKEFIINWNGQPCYSPCAIKKKKKDGNGDEILLWRDSKKLFSYDPMTQNCIEVRDMRSFIIEQNPILHINSLVSLKALGEEDAEYAEKWWRGFSW